MASIGRSIHDWAIPSPACELVQADASLGTRIATYAREAHAVCPVPGRAAIGDGLLVNDRIAPSDGMMTLVLPDARVANGLGVHERFVRSTLWLACFLLTSLTTAPFPNL